MIEVVIVIKIKFEFIIVFELKVGYSVSLD